MLDGVRSNRIVVGAYTDGRGGICPMLAAHRNGGRTSFLSFARAWDAFARAERVRPATERELRVLEDLLVTSLAEDPGGDTDLAAAIAEHQASVRRRGREIVARRLRPSGVRWLRLNPPIPAAPRHRGRSPEPISREPGGPTTWHRG
jgi:hypothetical protein